jgi:[protein-PII] uridylyltransferase
MMAGHNVRKLKLSDDHPSVSLWRRWLQPLESVRETSSPPLDVGSLETAIEPAISSTEAKFRKAMLETMKTALSSARQTLTSEFETHNDGSVYVGRHAWIMDLLIGFIVTQAGRRFGLDGKKHRMAVVAVGGYGRGELAPFSDVDILFLMSETQAPAIEKTIEFSLYLLWDLGLKVGHATRTVRETVDTARADQTVLTGLLEMRKISGHQQLYGQLESAVAAIITKTKASDFVEQKLTERDQRHARLGATRYVVEPNIKEGKGGLRDLHTLFWIAKFAYRTNNVLDLVDQIVLRDSEARRFAAAQRFLWTVRCHLHLFAGRAEERLDFEGQMAIAPLMGFSDRGGLRAVERFMKRYYLAARDVGNLTRIICAAVETDFRKRRSLWSGGFLLGQNVGQFSIRGGRVHLADDILFRDEPVRMLRIFQIAQDYDADIHPHALKRITRALPSMGAQTREDREANELFISILTSRKNPERILRLMNESGVLGKFLPDFGRIVAMMQFDMYHSYTVDEHTIKTIGVLHQIESNELAKTAPVATHVMPEIESRRALFVAMFLHDMAKGRGGDHSILGAELALTLCPGLGLTREETETVSWLVKYHLLMSKTAFRYDLNDPKTIQDFADIVQSPERLKLLLVLTVADIRGVGPNIWNGWKAALMRDLYSRADAVLRGADPEAISAGSAIESQRAVREELASWSDEEFATHASNLPVSYWTSFDTRSQVMHAELSREFRQQEVPLLIDLRPEISRRITEMTVLSIDDAGLFSRIAGAVASSGVTIVGARIATCSDGSVLDVFILQTTENEAVSDPLILERLQKNVEEAITGSFRANSMLNARWRQTPKRVRHMPVPSRVILSNKISSTHTVIEINGRDFPGLLYQITKTIASLGLQIQSSSVSTYGERVVDVFYVKDLFGLQIHNEVRLQTIKEKLLAVFDMANEVAS